MSDTAWKTTADSYNGNRLIVIAHQAIPQRPPDRMLRIVAKPDGRNCGSSLVFVSDSMRETVVARGSPR